MENVREQINLEEFSPVYGGDSEETKTITFKMTVFEELFNTIESVVIFELNKDKKAMSGGVIDNMFKYLDDECTTEDVLASLEEHKKSYTDKAQV